MLTCPVCRSQNMETAKFCGNCGNPFPRASASTSSLLNCAQGHVYSAIYASCPYCPQPANGPVSEFATSVEEPGAPITKFDLPASVTTMPTLVHDDSWRTRAGLNETVIDPSDTAINGAASRSSANATPEPPPGDFVFDPTEVLTALNQAEPEDELEQAPPSFPTYDAPTYVALDTNGTYKDEKATNPAPTSSAFASAAPPPAPPAPAAPAQLPQAAPPIDEEQAALDAEFYQRTTMVAEGAIPSLSPKGRIVGWLISYSHNPDGEDFRLHAGYNRLGANPVCDIVVDDETVSGSHAIIVYRDGKCLIKDDLSRNGTYVNGREIGEAYPLQSYDQIRVGNTYLTFVAAQRVA